MVFMGEGSPEEGKDAVAGGLHDEALIAMDGVHHELEGRIDKTPGRFGIEVFNQRGGVLDIGKERGDRLALTIGSTARFQRGLLGANTFGKVRWRVVDWGKFGVQGSEFEVWTLDLGPFD
jgi:hypothetical protein